MSFSGSARGSVVSQDNYLVACRRSCTTVQDVNVCPIQHSLDVQNERLTILFTADIHQHIVLANLDDKSLPFCNTTAAMPFPHRNF